MQCQIKWVDENGATTADTNTAIGRVQLAARIEQHHGRALQFSESPWYFICECHTKRLTAPGMHNWKFEALPG